MLSKLLYSPLRQKSFDIVNFSFFGFRFHLLVGILRRAGLTLWLAGMLNVSVNTSAAELDTPANFLGSLSCSSASCHGGAVTNKDQYLVWSRQDYHSRAYATLTTARSKRLAEVLKIGDAAQSPRCTACHAPFHEVASQKPKSAVKAIEGISCESCHGPAGEWIQTHTRTDLTHGQKGAAGLVDLKNGYVRANSCVACHQNVEPELLHAGHPELIFELDGQCVTQPRHWREQNEFYGPALWLVGQAAALREMSWQLNQIKSADPKAIDRWGALLWLLKRAAAVEPAFTAFDKISSNPNSSTFAETRQLSDKLALQAASHKWSEDLARKLLVELAGTQNEFTDPAITQSQQARRAERLVLALDRLMLALPSKALPSTAKEELNELFKAVQSLPDFEAAKFAARLSKFHKTLF